VQKIGSLAEKEDVSIAQIFRRAVDFYLRDLELRESRGDRFLGRSEMREVYRELLEDEASSTRWRRSSEKKREKEKRGRRRSLLANPGDKQRKGEGGVD